MLGTPLYPLVALTQTLLNLRFGLAVQAKREDVVFNAFAPKFIQCYPVNRPGCIGAVELIIFVQRKIELPLKQVQRVSNPLIDTLSVNPKNVECRRKMCLQQGIVQLIAINGKTVNVPGGKVAPVRIERFEIAVKNQVGRVIIQLQVFVVMLVYNPNDNQGCLALFARRLQLFEWHHGSGRLHRCSTAQEQRKHRR